MTKRPTFCPGELDLKERREGAREGIGFLHPCLTGFGGWGRERGREGGREGSDTSLSSSAAVLLFQITLSAFFILSSFAICAWIRLEASSAERLLRAMRRALRGGREGEREG